MGENHKIKSGQINFESLNHPGSYACVVIRDGKFSGMTDDLRRLLIDALQCDNESKITNLEDMF
jgi:hypothetical protein